MAPLRLSQHLIAYDLESHIHDLLIQKDLLQNIGIHSNNNIDFGDIIETYSLLVCEIERLQQKLHPKIEVFEEEEEEIFDGKYRITHVMVDDEGNKRPAKREDFLIKNNEAIADAFNMLASWHKQYKFAKEYESKQEPDGSCFANRLELKDQELFKNMVLKNDGERCA
ncbi:MAG: hypothetical protein K9K34_06035 [Desulfarculaceae bacterium]|nr:hypothetical protein [Desulfarculaceae bacterium]